MIFFCILIFTLFINCDKSNTVLSPEKGEFFKYTAFDSSGTTVAHGWLLFRLQNDQVTGEWNIKKIGTANNIGPQIGRGILIGGYIGYSIWVDLQPQMRDNNVL